MKDLMDILLDENNRDPIVLSDEAGRQIAFEQVAIIPYKVGEERRLYVVLKPLDELDGVADDEAIVFMVDTAAGGNTVLKVEPDEEIALGVFEKYYELLDEAARNIKTEEMDRFIAKLVKKDKFNKK